MNESKELHSYQIRCAEQQSLIELLEKEVKRLNLSLKLAKDQNRRLMAMLVGPNPFTEDSEPPAPDTKKKTEEKKEPNTTQDTVEITSSEANTSNVEQKIAEEPFDFDKHPFPEEIPQGFATYKERITYECAEFINKYSFLDFYNEISKSIIGQESGLKKILAVIYNYIRTLASGERPEKCTAVMLTAPSGNGKSFLFKTLSRFFKTSLPSLVCSRKDASRLVPTGYRGATVNTVMSDFVSRDEYTSEQRYGILWLDEFDKIRFNNDTGGPQVQNQLLTYMDGVVEKYGDVAIDSQYVLWVASGSFNEVREEKKKNAQKTIGFVDSTKNYDSFDDISREDMLRLFSSETIGRFTLIVSLNRLSEEAVTNIILKMLDEIYRDLHLDTIVSKRFINTIAKSANTEFGCRNIYSTLYETCLKAYIDILQGGIYSIDDRPTVILEGPDDYSIIDEVTAEQIRYEDNGDKYL